MHITSVELAVTDPVATASWYAAVLGLATTAGTGAATVTVGSSVLHLVTAHHPPQGHHHLAFTVPAGGIRAARDWLAERLEPMTVDGSDIVAGPPAWHSESVYFPGPDGSILELIARHRLSADAHAPVPFGPVSLLSISEIGMPVDDVPATVDRLGSVLGLTPFGEAGQQFTAIGDDEGLLIVVRSGRTWFPTDHDVPDDGPLHVRVSGTLTATVDLSPGRSVSVHRGPSPPRPCSST